MPQIYVVDAKGLSRLAIVYHDQLEHSPLYQLLLSENSLTNKYITTETNIMTAFSMVSDLSHQLKCPKLPEALMRVVRYFFDQAVPNFALELKDKAKIFNDFGTFTQGHGTSCPLYILDSAFIAKELYPGAEIIGKSHTFYSQQGIGVKDL